MSRLLQRAADDRCNRRWAAARLPVARGTQRSDAAEQHGSSRLEPEASLQPFAEKDQHDRELSIQVARSAGLALEMLIYTEGANRISLSFRRFGPDGSLSGVGCPSQSVRQLRRIATYHGAPTLCV